jgi:hypothetical protein
VYITTKGNQIQISCMIDANPLLSNHITWKSNNKSMINTDSEQFYSFKFIPPNHSILTILNVRDVDDGEISCHVGNSIGRPVVTTTELRVKRQPVIIAASSVLKAAEDSGMGRSTYFECRAQSYPDATFKWKNSVIIYFFE